MTENPAAHERSGPDVASAIGAAENASALHETHTHPERTKSGEAHVEQAAGDPAMTSPRSGADSGADTAAEPEPEPEPGPSAAAAQSVRGARVSDRIAGD